MGQHVTVGVAALRIGCHYHTLNRAVRKHGAVLPGLLDVGRIKAFAVEKLPELRAELVRLGLAKEEMAAAVA